MEVFVLHDLDGDIIGVFSENIIQNLKELGIDTEDLYISRVGFDTIYSNIKLKDLSEFINKPSYIFYVSFNRLTKKITADLLGQFTIINQLIDIDNIYKNSKEFMAKILALNEEKAKKKFIELKKMKGL